MKLFYKKSAIALAVLSALPLSVCAADVAEIDGTTYESLETALSAADAGATVKLLADAEMNASVTLDKAITLDLNGKTVTNNSATTRPFFVTADAFTVIGNGGSIITPESNTTSYGLIDLQTANATLTLTDVTISGPTDGGSLIRNRKAGQSLVLTNVIASATGKSFGIVSADTPVNLNVSGGEYLYSPNGQDGAAFNVLSSDGIYKFDNVKATSTLGEIIQVYASVATFDNCDFTCTGTAGTYDDTCIAISSSKNTGNTGKVTINGGTYSADKFCVYIYNSGGEATINGGTFTGGAAALKADSSTNPLVSANMTVTDGTFNGPVSIGSEASLQVEAGQFSDTLKPEYLAEGASMGEVTDATGNKVTVVAGNSVAALIGTTPYASLAEALKAAQTGETVTVMQDASLNESITLDKAITLDLNGKTVTNNSATTRPFFVTADAFTVIGNGGSIITPESNTTSYGLIDLQTANATLTISDATLIGQTDDGSLIKCRKELQTVNLTNVNATATGVTYGIVNSSTPLNLNVSGGEYYFSPDKAVDAAVFLCLSSDGNYKFENVKATSTRGEVIQVYASVATFDNCDFACTGTAGTYDDTCIAISSSKNTGNTGKVTINGGTYSADKFCVYIYNSGGEATINGGTFTGGTAVLKADSSTNPLVSANITVTDGTFNGPVSIGSEASLQVEAGKFNTELDEKYLAPSCKLQPTTDGEGNIIYEVVPSTSGIDSVETAPVTDGAVYNMQGIKVADSVDGLPAGLYITGGKKILVK